MQMQHVLSLVALSEAGSIRSAAASLGRSQPGLTKNLRQIEDELGAKLFQRTSRGVIPTKIGQLVLARTRTIATDIQRLQEEVEQTKGGQHGSVSVCVSPLAATQIIPAALLSFRRRFPEVDVQISSGLFPVAIVPLREGQTDIVIGPRPPADQSHSLIVEPLVTTDIVIVTSKSSPHAKARSIGDLSGADWMMIGSPGGPGDIFEPVFRENGFRSPIARTSSESSLAAFEVIRSLGVVCTFRVVFFANNETDTLTWLSFQYAKQLPLLKSHYSLAQTYRQLRLHGKWPHAFVGERTRSIGPSEAKQEATRGDNSRHRDAKH